MFFRWKNPPLCVINTCDEKKYGQSFEKNIQWICEKLLNFSVVWLFHSSALKKKTHILRSTGKFNIDKCLRSSEEKKMHSSWIFPSLIVASEFSQLPLVQSGPWGPIQTWTWTLIVYPIHSSNSTQMLPLSEMYPPSPLLTKKKRPSFVWITSMSPTDILKLPCGTPATVHWHWV